jgi:hypothetical protein
MGRLLPEAVDRERSATRRRQPETGGLNIGVSTNIHRDKCVNEPSREDVAGAVWGTSHRAEPSPVAQQRTSGHVAGRSLA